MKKSVIVLFLASGSLVYGDPSQLLTGESKKHLQGISEAGSGTAAKQGSRPHIKHVNQGKGAYCTTASILMALQHTTGLDLSSEDLLSVLAGIRSASCGSGKLGNKVNGFCEILNIESKELEYNIQAIEQRQEQEEFAKNKLLEEIVPFLDKGCAVMVINSEKGFSHAVLATSFDSSSKHFVIHDPLKQGSEIWSIAKLAKCWPRDLKGVMLLRAQLIVNQEFHNKVLVPLPANREIDVMVSELVKIKFTDALTFPKQKLKNVFSDFAICPLHTLWEKGRKVDSVQGTPLWLKIKVAAGDPACLFWDDGEGGKRVVAVTGYRGGYKNFDGEMQITEIGEDGKLVKTWMKSAEVLQKGKSPRDCGGDSFYIIYPKKPLVESAVASETKNDNK